LPDFYSHGHVKVVAEDNKRGSGNCTVHVYMEDLDGCT
jgi:hypothetical protein